MIKLGRFHVSLEGLLALGLLVALSLGGIRCSAYRQGVAEAKLAQDYANAHKATLAGIRSRAVTDSVTKVTDSVTRRMTTQVAANRRLSARLDATLAANDSILSLPPDSVGEGVLRDQLVRTTEVARLYRDSTEMLLGSVERLLASQSEERSAWLAERAANDATIAAQRAVIRALERRECRVLGVRCPSRRTVFLGGAAATLLLVSVAR
jgi:molybdopterin converting factor small subunit